LSLQFKQKQEAQLSQRNCTMLSVLLSRCCRSCPSVC